jgi:hypothetical protein
MNDSFEGLLSELDLERPADPKAIGDAERTLGTRFPESYRAFLERANGAEGSVGYESYVILWPAEELVQHNEGYKVDDYAPELTFIGTDGGNEVFGFRQGDGAFVSAPLIGMAPEQIQFRGYTFRDFLASFP